MNWNEIHDQREAKQKAYKQALKDARKHKDVLKVHAQGKNKFISVPEGTDLASFKNLDWFEILAARGFCFQVSNNTLRT